jgi:group I intron endonuclease
MENEVVNDKSKVMGQIYRITNTLNDKEYVGQTWTHRKNRGVYKPFGYEGRFRDHISEAVCNTKKKQCRYLNNAIRAYGKDVFNVHLLHSCPIDELDYWEKYYISEYNTMYPNGYNLTNGGKSHVRLETDGSVEKLDTNTPKKRGGCVMRTEETRAKMSTRLKEVMNTDENKQRQMFITKEQHKNQKFVKFQGETIDLTNLDQYLSIKHASGKPFIVVKVNGKQTSFVGKYQSLEELREQAKEFLKTIATPQRCQIAGNPLEPL